jgi:hypothetical protein
MRIIERMFEHLDPAGGDGDRDPRPVDPLAGIEPTRDGTPTQRIAWVLTQRPSAATLAVLEGLVEEPALSGTCQNLSLL